MAVVIRLRREGKKNQPCYRIAVCDSRMPRDGRFIEIIGHFNPSGKAENVEINMEKFREWVSKGAKPSPRVQSLVKQYRTHINKSLGL